jgi:hypothetical protein
MKSINWNGFDGKRFQRLCNSLLLFEVSKFAHVFSAEGKDDGIDQYYEGSYSGKTGKWRFQDKFHNSGEKKADIRELKRDIENDIKDNYQGENFIVFLTNVNLSKTKFYELLALGNDTLKSMNIENCEFMLWHEADIESRISNNQIIYNWFWETDTILLQPPSVYFSKELDNENADLRYQLHNQFIGRKADVEYLDDFLNTGNSTLAIVANGGYGKTRLCIEFFKLIEQKDEWMPLALYHTGYNASHLFQLLKTKKRLIIFIDDAHEIPEIVGDVKKLIDGTNGQHKLLLTTRNTLFSEIVEKIPTRSRDIIRWDLKKLDYSETKEMFTQSLPFLKERDIVTLANFSKGVPNVILEFIRLIRDGKQPYEISSESSFADSVMEIFKQAAEAIEKKLFIPKDKTNDFIKLISLISPLNDISNNKSFISKVVDIAEHKVEEIIGQLSEMGLLNKNGLAIKPDSYSDTILVQTIKNNKDFIEYVRNQEGAGKYFENILKNLAEAEIAEKDKSLFIEKLLIGYIDLIKRDETEPRTLKSIFQFVNKIFYTNPRLAAFSTSYFLEIYKNPTHKIHSELEPWESKTYLNTICEEVERVFTNLFYYTLYAKDNLETLHQMLLDYVQLTGHFNLVGACYGYRETDFNAYSYPRKCCEKQLFLIDIVCQYLENSDDEFLLKFSLEASKKLLELDFRLDHYYEEATNQIHYGTAPVPTCSHTLEIRARIVNSLINFYNRYSGSLELKEIAFKEFLHYLFYCSTNYNKRHKYEFQQEEIQKVLDFFITLLNDKPSANAKSQILYLINIRSKEYKPEFVNSIELIKEAASKLGSLYEELEMCAINEDYFDVQKNFENKLRSLCERYSSFNELQSDLITISKVHKSKQNLPQILWYLSLHYPEEAKSFFEKIRNHHSELLPEFKILVTANYKDKLYFYEVLNHLWSEKEKYAHEVFWLLTFGRRREKDYYEAEDLNLFETAINERLEQTYYFIANDLLNYAYKDKIRTFTLLSKFLKIATIDSKQRFIIHAFDKNENYSFDFKDELKILLFDNMEFLRIDEYPIDHMLDFLDRQHGFKYVFEFVQKRVALSLQGDDYKYLNLQEYPYEMEGLSEGEKISRFIEVVKWFIENYTGSEVDFEYVVSFFHPMGIFSKEFQNVLMSLRDEYLGDYRRLNNLATAVGSFPPSSEYQIITLCRITEACIESTNEKVNVSNYFSHDYYRSSGGVKTGRGVPYPQDVAKRDFLKKILSENTFLPQVTNFLEKCIARLDKAIYDEINRHNKESDW